MDLILCFQQHFALFAFSALDGFVNDASGFFFRAADLFFRDFLAVRHANKEEQNPTHDETCDAQDQT